VVCKRLGAGGRRACGYGPRILVISSKEAHKRADQKALPKKSDKKGAARGGGIFGEGEVQKARGVHKGRSSFPPGYNGSVDTRHYRRRDEQRRTLDVFNRGLDCLFARLY